MTNKFLVAVAVLILAAVGYTHWALATVPDNESCSFSFGCSCSGCNERYCGDDIGDGDGYCDACAARLGSCAHTENGEPACGNCSLHCTRTSSDSSSTTSGSGGDDIDDDTGSTSSTSATLMAIFFDSDHEDEEGDNILINYTSDWSDPENPVVYEEPEWTSDPGASVTPISHTKNQAVTVTLGINLAPKTEKIEIEGTSSSAFLNFFGTLDGTQTPTATYKTLTLTSVGDAVIPDAVDILDNLSISWKYRTVGDDQWASLGESNHKIYVTYGTPGGSDVTEKRIIEVCTLAVEKSEGIKCAEAIFDKIAEGGEIAAESDDLGSIWEYKREGVELDCKGLALYVKAHFDMIGLGGDGDEQAVVKYAYGDNYGYKLFDNPPNVSTRSGGHPDHGGIVHGDDREDEETFGIEFLYLFDENQKFHKYQAAVAYGARFYAIGIGREIEYYEDDLALSSRNLIEAGGYTVCWGYWKDYALPWMEDTVLRCEINPWSFGQ